MISVSFSVDRVIESGGAEPIGLFTGDTCKASAAELLEHGLQARPAPEYADGLPLPKGACSNAGAATCADEVRVVSRAGEKTSCDSEYTREAAAAAGGLVCRC